MTRRIEVWMLVVIGFLGVLYVAGLQPEAWAKQNVFEESTLLRISKAHDGSEANGDSLKPVMAGNGRYLTFASKASNLVQEDENNLQDVFVYDVELDSITLVTRHSDGTQANGLSENPDISTDGRFVVFDSLAQNLVNGDSNNFRDIFLHDQDNGETVLVSLTHDGQSANGSSYNPAISGNGRFVAFDSLAQNLVSNDTNQVGNVFVRDMQGGTMALVSAGLNGQPPNGNSYAPDISEDGRFVTFYSSATNLVAGDSIANFDVFLHDRETGQTICLSRTANGDQALGDSYEPTISANGRYVAYLSDAGNLVSGDDNDNFDIFLYDRLTGYTRLISRAPDGSVGDDGSFISSLSADGRYIAFFSAATNLVPGDQNGAWDAFVRDVFQQQTWLLSQNQQGASGNGNSSFVSISGDGLLAAFDSLANDLVPEDENEFRDIFLVAMDYPTNVYLPLILRPAVYDISGVVTNGGLPLAGVTVRTNSGETAVSNSSGVYRIKDLLPGVYQLSPSLPGYAFNPAVHTVSLPPGVTNANFTATPIQLPTATAMPTPTATPVPTSPPPPSPTPDPCQQLVLNGGFEQQANWVIGDNAYPAVYDTAVTHSGSWALRAGIVNPLENVNSYSSAWQVVSVPPNLTSATFSFWLYTTSSGTRMVTAPEIAPIVKQDVLVDDSQFVLVYDEANQQHTLLFQRLNEQVWTLHQFDLAAFAGQTIQLYFGVYNNGVTGVTGMYVDDVSLRVCVPLVNVGEK